MKYVNFYRNIKGRFDLMVFLYTWDPDYRKDLLITFLAFGLLFYSLTTGDDFYDIIAMAIELSIVMIQLGGEMSILPADYRPKHGGVIYTGETSGHVLYGELSFPMSEILPCKAEAELGFTNTVEDIKKCKESPLVSDKVDDALMTRDFIPYRDDKSKTNYISSRHQLRYIAIRIANKNQHSTNGRLLGFCDLASALVDEDEPINVREARYFDYILTMEAFRSRIFRGNLNSEKEVYTDLTTYFPVKKVVIDGKDRLRFKSDFYRQIPNLVGITSLILNENNRVVTLWQGTNKVMGAGVCTLGGSGSLDYADMAKSGMLRDFRDVLRYGLAREVAEETGMVKYFSEIRSNTMVIGFFRWIDRVGLPEFIGLTRAGNVPFAAESNIDGDEIVKHEEVPVDIKKPEDFVGVLEYFQKENIELSLSSLMALKRLIVISEYNRDDASEDQRFIYYKVAKFISGE